MGDATIFYINIRATQAVITGTVHTVHVCVFEYSSSTMIHSRVSNFFVCTVRILENIVRLFDLMIICVCVFFKLFSFTHYFLKSTVGVGKDQNSQSDTRDGQRFTNKVFLMS